MPIATPQGTLDFKSVDTITFVGASSNTVIDTTTGSLGVGVDGNGPTSNLHVVGNTRLEGDINMLHTSNTASIKLNSNVVTEFTRSKKLIKYPRVAMTGETTSNYTVTASSWYNSPALGGSGTQYEPWKAFDNVGNQPTGQLAWYSFDYPTTEAYSGTDNAFNPNHGGTATPDLFTGAVQGEWLKIQLPHKVALDRYIMYGPNQENEFPRDWTVYGSADGTNWVRVDDRVSQIFGAGTGGGGTATGKKKEYQLDTQTNEYLYFAFVFTRGPVNKTQYLGVGEIELYGVPEYDPEADGVDVTVKSLPNVPNTDWLEVYYDGQDYSTMPTTVTDKSGNNRTGTPSAGGVGFDTEYKAFTFNKTNNQYLSTSTPMSGNYVHSFSAWFKPNSLGPGGSGNVGGDALFYVGGVTGSSDYKVELFMETDRINYTFGGNNFQAYPTIVNGKWYHIVVTYNGLGGQNGREIYLNNVKLNATHSGSTGTLNLPSSNLDIGRYTPDGSATTSAFDGSIANFRLFNRALTTDEIYQLYAYQKEYFGHGDLGMTLKAGRLGIGTSEPRAALDVRGDIYAPGTIVQVEQTVKTNPSAVTSTTEVDIGGLSVDITPKFGTSKVLVSYIVNVGVDTTGTSNMHGFLRVKRTQGGISTYIGDGASSNSRQVCTSYIYNTENQQCESFSFEHLDDTNGIDTITYQIQGLVEASVYTMTINRSGTDGNNGYYGRTSSSITVKEVCQ